MGAARLLTKVVELETREVLLKDIEILPDRHQTRARTDMRIVSVYGKAMAGGSVFPPAVVFRTPDGRLILADGFHRVEARKRLGFRNVMATIREGTAEDAIIFGIRANFSPDNIREVTPDDRKHAVELMIRSETFREWSDTGIAEACGACTKTVRISRNELRDAENIPLPDRVRYIKNGQPTGRTGLYKTSSTTGVPAIFRKHDGSYSAKVHGRQVYLGRDAVAARNKVQSVLNAYGEVATEWRKVSQEHLGAWLTRRGILFNGRGQGNTLVGGVRVGESLVFTVGYSDFDSVLAAIGRAVIGHAEAPDSSRIIVIGYLKSTASGASNVGRLITAASLLSPPVEFMTPEEFIAEFGGTPEEPESD